MNSIEIAKKDNIRISRTGAFLEYVLYHPSCSQCGNEFTTTKYEHEKQYVCKECREKQQNSLMAKKREKIIDRAIVALKRNIHINRVFEGYLQSIEAVKRKNSSGMKFDSKEEVMVAIQLEKDEIKYETQIEIVGHKVDFVLSNLKVVLEVDGKLYHTDHHKDALIDERVKSALGSGWEVIRISDDNIHYYLPALKKCIQAVLDEKRLYYSSYSNDDFIIESVMMKEQSNDYLHINK